MPLETPNLDDRNFEQLLTETKRRIPAHTPEWTNYNVESDPGITLVELFAFLTDNLLYRANRIPERNRIKFLQLLGIPLQPAAAAEGIITIQNERGPLQALQLEKGIIVAAGNTHFITRDNLTALPIQAQVYYKRKIDPEDERHQEFELRYEALLAAISLASDASGGTTTLTPVFYESVPMTQPSAADPAPVLDLVNGTTDQAIYLALLAPKNVDPGAVREKIANKTLSIGIAPALTDEIASLPPQRRGRREPMPDLVYEIAAPGENKEVDSSAVANYDRLTIRQQPAVLAQEGIVQVVLPKKADQLEPWSFPEPMQEGSAAFPPTLEDEEIEKRLVTWIRIRLPQQGDQQGVVNARLSWVGINAARVIQGVPVTRELLGTGNGEPDQTVSLANTPILPDTIRLEVEESENSWQLWRLTDDLLSADIDERVFTLDPESGQIRFGTGINGLRPGQGQRIRASYEYGGGAAGNVAIGEIKKSLDPRLQGGYKINNPLPTMGGDRGETADEGQQNIPLYMRHRDRLVTLQDFEDVTLRTPGVDVGRVEVLPLFQPTNPTVDGPGVVTLMVIPESDAVTPYWPSPDRHFLQQVCDHLDSRRLVTTELYVRGPSYVSVHLSIGVQIREGYYRDDVLQAIRVRLHEYLSSLPPGGPDEDGWPLNRRLLRKDLEAVVTRVAGVEYVNTDSMEMGVGTTLGLDEYNLSGLELPLLSTLELREGEAEPLSDILSGGGDGGDGTTPPTIQPVPVPVARTIC